MSLNGSSAAQTPEHYFRLCEAIIKKLEEHRCALRITKRVLPAFLSEQCLDCVTRANKVILFTGSAAWASQLRFYGPAVLNALNAVYGERFESLQTHIYMPREAVATNPPGADLDVRRAAPEGGAPGMACLKPDRQPRIPSSEAIAQINQNALYSHDGRLKQSLLRLGRTLKQSARSRPA